MKGCISHGGGGAKSRYRKESWMVTVWRYMYWMDGGRRGRVMFISTVSL